MQRGRSGVGQYVLALTRALLPLAHRHEFTLFVLEEDRPLLAFAEPAMRIVEVPEPFRSPLADIGWHQTLLPAWARRLGLDVLHVPSYRRMLWRQPCALVATIHDLAPFHLQNKYSAARMFYGRVVARRLAARQHRVIAVSETTARDLTRYFNLPRQRVTVIPNGLDHDRFQPGPAEAAKAVVATRNGVDRPFFLYVARLEHPAKNHLRLIEAFNRFKAETCSPWQLVLGGSDWHGAEVIHAAVAQSPYARDICCPGFVSDADLPIWYRAADVFVYPSLFEGFGMPPLEAMACGCPVISSGAGALAEVVGDAAVVIDPLKPAALVRELGRLAADPAARAELRRVGSARARRFSWRTNAEATVQVYAEACSPSRGTLFFPARAPAHLPPP